MADAVSLLPATRPDTDTGPARSVLMTALFLVPEMLRECPLGMSLGATSSLSGDTSTMSQMTIPFSAAMAMASSVMLRMPVMSTSLIVTSLPKMELARMTALDALSNPSTSLVGSVSA